MYAPDFPYEWMLADGFPAKGITPNGRKVFGTFICGGGSSMGYKLAGYEHLGGVEIDPKIADIYRNNLHPKYLYVEDLREFNKRKDLPDELYNLDMLDGSPPCTTFSTSGKREKVWGISKKFAEGQSKQTLDDLIFTYADTILKLRPKVFLSENVSGFFIGNAKAYAARMVRILTEGGYRCQMFLLNASTMGVPQARIRSFVIGHRKEYMLPPLSLDFHKSPIPFRMIKDPDERNYCYLKEGKRLELWRKRRPRDKRISDICIREYGEISMFNNALIKDDMVNPTILSSSGNILFDCPRFLTHLEMIRSGTFPLDYDFTRDPMFIIGMSVPPVMMAALSWQINAQWLSKI